MAGRVVLVYPANKFGGSVQLRVELPLSVLAVGTPLHRAGHHVTIVDQRVDENWRGKLEDALAGDPVCVGISSMTGPQIRNGLEVARIVKARGDAPVVWGGIHPTLLPHQTLAHELVDIVVRGEGEETMLELVAALERGSPLAAVRGISFTEDGKIRDTGDRPPVDLGAQPVPAYELVDLKKYLIDVFGRGHISLETSRGCPFRCSYCYNTGVYEGTWRAMSPDEVMRRVRVLVEDHGIKGILFTDDNFFGKTRRAMEILRRIAEADLDITVSKVDANVATLSNLSDEDMEVMKRAGCRMVMMGIESGSPDTLKLLHKHLDVDGLLDFNRRLRGSGIKAHYFFMMGFPGETLEDLKQTIDLKFRLSDENPECVPRFNIFTPFPGTGLHEVCREAGFEPPERLEGWVSFNYRTVNARAVWMTKRMRKTVRMLHFATLLAEKNNFLNPYKKTRFWVKALAWLYYPIARFRVKHLCHILPLDLKLAEWTGVYPKQGG